MRNKRIIILLAIAALSFTAAVVAEDITLTTYYPAPYGEYRRLYVSDNVGIANTSPDTLLTVGSVPPGITLAAGYSGVFQGNIVGVAADGTAVAIGSCEEGSFGEIFAHNYISGSPIALILNRDGGNVGIGTPTVPTARLQVNGDIKAVLPNIAGGSPMEYIPGLQTIGYDVAELFEANEEVEPGDILSIDKNGNLKKSVKAYDTRVAGIVSEAPALLFEGSQLRIAPQPFEFKGGRKPPLALAGRVRCKVTTQGGGPIEIGDLLVSSSKPGYAMRAKPENVRVGTVLGKALEPLDKGDGKISVLVTLQ